MLHKAGVVSFYGPSVMCELGEYVKMFDYTKEACQNILFKENDYYEIKSSPFWSKEFVYWQQSNMHIAKKLIPEVHGYEVLQGKGVVEGQLLGGCIDVFPMTIGTEIWPVGWQNKILLIETSEEMMPPNQLLYYLRNLGADEYKEIYIKVLKEYKCENLPVLYNINIGHAFSTGILPLGTNVKIDFDSKQLFLIESPVLK